MPSHPTTFTKEECDQALSEFRSLLERLRPLLETHLVVQTQEYEFRLIHGLTLKLARLRYLHLCTVLEQDMNLATALRLCASLTLDLESLAQRDPKAKEHCEQFLSLYARCGYKSVNGNVQL
jgi:hypothetical protein